MLWLYLENIGFLSLDRNNRLLLLLCGSHGLDKTLRFLSMSLMVLHTNSNAESEIGTFTTASIC